MPTVFYCAKNGEACEKKKIRHYLVEQLNEKVQ